MNVAFRKINKIAAAFVALAVLLYTGCDLKNEAVPVTRDFFAMDTYMTLTCCGDRAEEAADAAQAEIERLDELLSTGNELSEISVINKAGGGALSGDSRVMVEKAFEIYERSGGAFDITVLPLMKLWGFDTDTPKVPAEADINESLKKVGMEMLTFDGERIALADGQGIDLGGIAKGYTSDRLMKIFEEYGLTSGMVSLGGNVQCYRTKPDGTGWRCGISDPKGEGYFAVVEASDKAIITSGGYERYFEENGRSYHHIVDPKTGYPAESGLLSVTIVSSDGMLADALSTACYVLGVEGATEYWRSFGSDFDMILMDESGTIHITAPLEEYFSCEREYSVIER